MASRQTLLFSFLIHFHVTAHCEIHDLFDSHWPNAQFLGHHAACLKFLDNILRHCYNAKINLNVSTKRK